MPNKVELLRQLLDLASGNNTAPSALPFKDSGSTDLAKDFSSGKNLKIDPGQGERYAVYSFLISAAGGGSFQLQDYGSIPALTNGIRFRVKQNGVWRDFYPEPIKSNADLLHYSLSGQPQNYIMGGPAVGGIFGGFLLTVPIFINGDEGDQLQIKLKDDFSGLGFHKIAITAAEV